MRSLFIVVGVDVAVNSRKMFSVIMEMKQWVPFALLSSYERFRNVGNTSKYQILRQCACSLALVIGHVNRIFSASCYVITYDLSGYIIFFTNYLTNGTIFETEC
jgi:hypothetical protein